MRSDLGWKTILVLAAFVAMPGSGIGQGAEDDADESKYKSHYKWHDARGRVTYQDTRPSGDIEYEEWQVRADDDENLGNQDPVSFFAVPDCDSCDLVRQYLEKQKIPFSEKNIKEDADARAELQAATGQETADQLIVPSVVIGSDVIDGYSRGALKRALKANGYLVDQDKQEKEEKSAGGGLEPLSDQ